MCTSIGCTYNIFVCILVQVGTVGQEVDIAVGAEDVVVVVEMVLVVVVVVVAVVVVSTCKINRWLLLPHPLGSSPLSIQSQI